MLIGIAKHIIRSKDIQIVGFQWITVSLDPEYEEENHIVRTKAWLRQEGYYANEAY